jgi:hypothetical protein
MSSIHERTVADEVADARMDKPHVVVLGAGASRATCPTGDKKGRALPLMADFSECLGIGNLLREWGLDPSENFEEVYSNLAESGEHAKLESLESLVEQYFEALELPDHPTVYDHLILSLRSQDLIATFNWDPLLLQAYQRNDTGLSRPKLAFLHGNVLGGYCETDRLVGLVGHHCPHCGKALTKTRLLYPVRHKNYAENWGISSQWELLKRNLRDAFMITVFGYSGPKTDQEAIEAMRGAWGPTATRSMEQTAFINRQSPDEIRSAWSDFIHTHHYEVQSDFYDSWIAKHPRRTGEAYVAQYIDACFISDNPIPRNAGFDGLWAWFDQFQPAEDTSAKK